MPNLWSSYLTDVIHSCPSRNVYVWSSIRSYPHALACTYLCRCAVAKCRGHIHVWWGPCFDPSPAYWIIKIIWTWMEGLFLSFRYWCLLCQLAAWASGLSGSCEVAGDFCLTDFWICKAGDRRGLTWKNYQTPMVAESKNIKVHLKKHLFNISNSQPLLV